MPTSKTIARQLASFGIQILSETSKRLSKRTLKHNSICNFPNIVHCIDHMRKSINIFYLNMAC